MMLDADFDRPWNYLIPIPDGRCAGIPVGSQQFFNITNAAVQGWQTGAPVRPFCACQSSEGVPC